MENEQPKTIYSWNDIVNICKNITDRIREREWFSQVTCILTIPRGGLVPSRVIAEFLGIDRIVTRLDDVKGDDFALIVDDISDSGKTLVKLVNKYQETKGFAYKTVTIFVRDGTHYEPDFLGERLHHDKWIEFPWETKGLESIIDEVTDE